MAKTLIRVRIDEDLKKEANELFAALGLDMSTAVNVFLRQCIFHSGLPFEVELPKHRRIYQGDVEEP